MFNPYDPRLITDDDADHRARTPPSLGGDDFAYGYGSPIISPAPGVIDLADNDPGGSGGRMVGVRHGGGVRSEQLHASRLLYPVGTEVGQGQTIAWSGGSAYGSEHGVGYHIHAHFVVNGVRWGWMNYLNQSATAGGGGTPIEPEIEENTMGIYTRIGSGENAGQIYYQDNPGAPLLTLVLAQWTGAAANGNKYADFPATDVQQLMRRVGVIALDSAGRIVRNADGTPKVNFP